MLLMELKNMSSSSVYLGSACLNRQVLDLMIRYIGPLYNWLQQFTNHYLTRCHLLPAELDSTITRL
jgi:hypothetical protein